jgi:hypothetical protein
MNTISSNLASTMSIAWFRLHEASSKNEHERAFLNYKLLMHSYQNQGFQKQILGDLHTLFDETELAKKSFEQAFLIYLQEEDYISAILIYLKIKKHTDIILEEKNLLIEYLKKNKKKFILFFDEIE